jgi:hypothetical protein
MSKIRELLAEIFILLFPLLRLRKANKLVDAKINRLENGEKLLSYMKGYESLAISEAEVFLTKTLEARKTLEEKAKTNVLGVTISVSLIIGLSQVFHNNYPSNSLLRCITVLLAFYSLTSIILSTMLSLKILGKVNIVYDLFPTDKTLTSESEKLDAIAVTAELNMYYNVKRNSYLYSSYVLIIHFLISLSILFLLVVLPDNGGTNNTLQNIQESQSEIYKEVYKLKGLKEIQMQQMYRVERLEEADKAILKQIDEVNHHKNKK